MGALPYHSALRRIARLQAPLYMLALWRAHQMGNLRIMRRLRCPARVAWSDERLEGGIFEVCGAFKNPVHTWTSADPNTPFWRGCRVTRIPPPMEARSSETARRTSVRRNA